MRRRLVLFDIDGTLLHSRGAGRRAILTAIGEVLGDHTAFERVRFDGKTDPQILMELFEAAGHPGPPAAEQLAALGRTYVRLLEEELARPDHETRVLPGVAALLDRLEHDAAVLLGLLTGNFVEGAGLKLRSAGIDPGRFRLGAYGTDSHDRASLPPIAATRAEPWFGRVPRGEEVVIIGDTPADVTCGRSIGARALAVATGSYSAAELRAAGAFAVFDDLGNIEAVVEAVLA